MTPRVAYTKLMLRLNKLASSDYDNIPFGIAVEAINKAALDWCRRQMHGVNNQKEGDEESRMRVDDLQILLRDTKLTGKNHATFFESEPLPKDYLWYKRILPICYTKECSGGKGFKSFLVEEANVPDYLQDASWKPSFEWEHSFHTIMDNTIRVYTNNDFAVKNIEIVYYRRPYRMDIAGYEHENGAISKDIDLEFKDDVAELIIDEAAAILAGDIESANQMQIASGRVENNN